MSFDKVNIGKPVSDNQELWRYMNFPTFVDLIRNSHIFFRRSNCFEDKKEGKITEETINNLKSKGFSEQNIIGTIELAETNTNICYVSCWYCSNRESLAMWDLYGKDEFGIAIKTKVAKLNESLENRNYYCGRTVYYENDTKDYIMDLYGVMGPLFYKYDSYEHENEYRILTIDLGPRVVGIYVKTNLNLLIDEIVVGPRAPIWLFKLVSELKESFGLKEISIRKSNIELRKL